MCKESSTLVEKVEAEVIRTGDGARNEASEALAVVLSAVFASTQVRAIPSTAFATVATVGCGRLLDWRHRCGTECSVGCSLCETQDRNSADVSKKWGTLVVVNAALRLNFRCVPALLRCCAVVLCVW